MNVGLLFGSFNPIHYGHLTLAKHMIDNGYVDEVWFVVSPQNPFKPLSTLADARHRLAMARLAIAGYNNLCVSDIELSLPIPSYTVDTMRALVNDYPNCKFSIIMGADNLASLHGWKDSSELLRNFRILVYPRPGWDCNELKNNIVGDIVLTEASQLEISSTKIREMIAGNQSIESMVDKSVAEYISKNRLYIAQSTD